MQIKVENNSNKEIVPKAGDLLVINDAIYTIYDDGDTAANLYVRPFDKNLPELVIMTGATHLFKSIELQYNITPELGVNYFPIDRAVITLGLGE